MASTSADCSFPQCWKKAGNKAARFSNPDIALGEERRALLGMD